MMSDQWTNRLSEYLDDELPDSERIALEAHLQSCPECSTIVGDLRRVIRRARTLKEQAPPQDLWPAIARRIGASTPAAAQTVELASRRPSRRRWTFSLPQLAAAGIGLMVASGGAVWLVSNQSQTPTVVSIDNQPSPTTPVMPAALRPTASQSYAAAVADLERVLEEGRGRLDTTTVKVIEQNLAAIDRAIDEAQRALQADSANLYLNSHLAETMRRKLDLLRQAAALVRVS
jgi:predicted anti-sigma-YlaC factor YlaD